MGIFIDPSDLPDTIGGKVQLFFLLFVYGFILSKSSGMISDGSELLLLIPALAGIVGSVVLPVLGAVPDGAIVLFSGMGPIEEVNQQIAVGVGALAGSTIMLLTIPWALCIITGRVDIIDDRANYMGKPKLSEHNKWSLFKAGITPRNSISFNAKIMMLTSLSYFIIQGAAFGSQCATTKDCSASKEHWFALIALIFTIIFFVGYMVYNVKFADTEDKEDLIVELKKQAIESHILSLSTAFEADLGTSIHDRSSVDGERRFNEALRSFFQRYDRDGNGVIDPFELRVLLKDVNENMSEERFQLFLKEIDTDNSGAIEFREFAEAMKQFIAKKSEHGAMQHSEGAERKLTVQTHEGGARKHDKPGYSPIVLRPLSGTVNAEGVEESSKLLEEGGEEEEEEEEEVPEDIALLPPEQQKTRILLRSAWMMGLGTLVVLLFSDPMVDVLNEVGVRFHIPGFYVAFVLAPLASNASELIASIAYAQKKTKKTITISLAALEGAACMNNTFCLAIFLVLIFARGLEWAFTAETIAIVFVEFCIFMFSIFFKTQKVWHSLVIFSLYPLSLLLVWVLENPAGLD